MQTLSGQLLFDLVDEPDQAGQLRLTPAAESASSMPVVAVGGLYWRAWTADTPRAVALAAFRERYQGGPQTVVISRGLLLLGPVSGPWR
jgi:hypothetical protein